MRLFAFHIPAQLLASYFRNEFLGGSQHCLLFCRLHLSYKNSTDTKTIFRNQIRAPPRRKKKISLFAFLFLFSVFKKADVLQL